MTLSEMRIGCAMTGSFCTFKAVFDAWRALKATGAALTPIMSFNAASVDTRFYPASEAVAEFASITGKRPLATLDAVEPIGPKKLLDALVIAPCTGNTLAKLAGGIADTPVTLAAKSHLRNGRPLVIAVSSNDALAQNAKNIGQLLAMRNIYFVPFAQDDPLGKPNSLVARFETLPETVKYALEGRQIQPILGRS
ncbi:MAG: dipicolinate synthase subunit B [Clostridia bacterium]|nr:dipicolinate synthase subunit B [Clostridia bacterium]MBR3273069.1 dipicolinate synthase subunit B [Clostridia bacterium]